MLRRAILPLAACAVAAAIMPFALAVTEAAVQRDGIGRDDLDFALAISAPFALLTALLIVWPIWTWQRSGRPLATRIAITAAGSVILPMVLLLPVAGELPWKAGVAGLGTMLIWLATYLAGAKALEQNDTIRSSSRG